jgi:Flp pilus assembly protein TadG
MRIVKQIRDEEGQAIVLVTLAMSIFLIGAVGLGFDGSHLYSQRQRAQTAADAAAQAAMMSVYDGTYGAGPAAFSLTSGNITCGINDKKTPCAYAYLNGFGKGSYVDTVTVSFPTSAPGVSLAPTGADVPVNLIQVKVSRTVPTTFMRLLGPTGTTVTATATAAIIDVKSPIPILVLHPHLTSKMPSPLSLQGTPVVTICGGPSRSIQVNSDSSTAFNVGGTAHADLRKAGPKDTKGTCTTGTGADIGVRGGPLTSPNPLTYYGVGKYVQPASIMQDPLKDVSPPLIPSVPGTQTPIVAGRSSGGVACPLSTAPHGCTLLTPGLFSSGISLSNTYAMFKPGIYYLQGSGGFVCASNCDGVMVSGTADTITGTGWDGTVANGGMLVYNTGTGQFQVGSNGATDLIGSSTSSSYLGILFFQDRTAAANNSDQKPPNSHSLGGGGALTLVGTIYLTNTVDTMLGNSKHYQELDLQGGSGSGTTVQGEIIVDTLQMGGTGAITMNLNSDASYIVKKVALVE